MAAVAGCVEAVLLMMAALLYFTYSAIGPWLAVFGAVFLGLAVACVVGSVLALRRRTPRVLLVAAATAAAIAVVLIAISVAGGGSFDAFSAAVVLLGVGPVVLLLQAPSREWFTASRSR
jgi:hypothetical protein